MSHDRVTVAVGAAAGEPARRGARPRARSTRPATARCGCGSRSTATGSSAASRSSATSTAASRSCSRCATTGSCWCWPTGTTGSRRSPPSSGVVLAVERLLGMEVPRRATWTRTLLAELNRVLSHLVFLGSFPVDCAAVDAAAVRGVRGTGGRAGGHGGGLRRPDALHVQPGRRPQGGPARRLARPGGAGRRRGPAPAGRAGRPGAGRRALPGGHHAASGCSPPRWSTRTASAGRPPAPPASTSTCDATSPTWPTPSCSPTACCGCRPAPRATPTPAFEVLLEQARVSLDLATACVERLRGPRPRPGERAAAEDPAPAGGLRRTPGRRTRWASTATTWSRAARRRRGG